MNSVEFLELCFNILDFFIYDVVPEFCFAIFLVIFFSSFTCLCFLFAMVDVFI